MVNLNTPFGFQHLGWNRGGAPVTGGQVERKIAAGYATAIGAGDLVQSLATGYVARGAAGVAPGNQAGIFIGCRYLSTALGRMTYSPMWPTGDHAYDGVAFIIPIAGVSPQLFKVQAYTANFTFADIGANVDINAGAVVNGISTMTVDRGTLAATATLPFKVIDLWSNVGPYGAPGTDDASSYNCIVVQSNPDGELGIL